MNQEIDTVALAAARVRQMPTSAIHEMTRLSKALDDVAFLSWAKPTSGFPSHIAQAAIQAIEEGKTGGYSEPAGLMALREHIAGKLREVNHIEATADEIIVTVGAIEGLAAAILALVDPGDEVLIPVPGYPTHLRLVEMASGRPVCVPTIEEEGFCLDMEKMRAAITPRTKAILYSDPNNPTGSVYSRDQLQALADLACEHNLMVITDEAYEHFTFDGCVHHSIASFPGMRERVISAFTFTKTYAMTGWRVGYVQASAAWMASIKKAHIPLAICAPVVSQYAALKALTSSQECVAEFREHYRVARDLMCERLDGLSEVFSYHKPQGSYLMFPRIRLEGGADSLSFAKNLLQQTRVSTTPGVAFGMESHLRMSFCVPENMIQKAFDRMEAYFKA
ncbi:MAG: aminotransferase class I/II-fold pyridoxal phosphate-dependent enzyme [Kiritimatiellia bacterium]|nr:aminotransferase class I/II-fold pyridoxal phosphate-dependent enzyme [Kiritimatiellia bacterium]